MGIYIFRDNQQQGPYEEALLIEAMANGSMHKDTMALVEGSQDWIPLAEILPPAPAPVIVHEVSAPKMSLASILLDSLGFPFCKSGWITIIVGAVCFAVARLFTGIFGGIAISGYLLAYYMDIIGSSANGIDSCPDWPGFSSLIDDIIRPYLQGMTAGIISVLPAIIAFILASYYESSPWMITAGALLVASLFYYPMAMIGVVLFGNIGGAFPHRVIPALCRTFPASLLLGIVNAALFALPVLNSYFARHLPLIGGSYQYCIYLYCMIVEARFLGLFYQRERSVIQWD